MKYLFLILLFAATQAQAQLFDNYPEEHPEVFEEKIRFGVVFQQTWTTILGSDQPFDYFVKPSLGGGGEFQYFFHKNWGIGTGFMYRQRGAGIITPDLEGGLGNGDSTYRHRLRMNCYDVPIKLQWRANKGAFKNSRWSGSLGLIPVWIPSTFSVFHSVEDGFHAKNDWNKDFKQFDLAATFSIGLDCNAAESSLFQMQLLTTVGLLNPYKKSGLYGTNERGFSFLIGLKMTAMFAPPKKE